MAYAGGYMSAIDPGLFRRDSEAVSTDAVKEARKLDPDLVVEAVVSNQQAAAALISAAEGADVLVVGSRGHGGFARLVLGSVSEQLAHHAPCPLTIVRPGTAQ